MEGQSCDSYLKKLLLKPFVAGEKEAKSLRKL